MKARRVISGFVGIGVAVLTVWASVAFACSPQPAVYSTTPESATPGDTVQVRGESVKSSKVEIRWNGVGGPLMAVANTEGNGAFSMPVEIPAVDPGIYSLSIVTPTGGTNRTAIEVTGTGPASPARATQLWPSLADAQPPTPASSDSSNALGLVLLAVGSTALAAGTGVVVVSRRRATAS